jgi:hypothetical protein
MSNPFDYATAILQTKKELIVDDLTEKEYHPTSLFWSIVRFHRTNGECGV